jgi:hypothetical protein
MASPLPLDKDFNAAYARRGLQPSVGGIEQTRNARVEYKTDPTLRRGGIDKEPLPLAQTVQDNQPRRRESATDSFFDNDSAVAPTTNFQPRNAATISNRAGKRGRNIRTGLSIKTSTAKLRGRSTTLTIWAWAFPSWIFVQLLFALISFLMFALAVAISGFTSALSAPPDKDDDYIVSAGKIALNTVFQGAAAAAKFINDYVLSFFGIDLTMFDPANLFLLTYLVVFAFGMLVLLAIYFIYKFAFLNPLSGEGGGMKIGALLLAIVGYSVPVLNLFPWFLPWTLAVMKNPK